MSATFEWQILNIECYPQFEEQTNVVTKIYWKCIATQIDGNNTFTEQVERNTTLNAYKKGDAFIPYNELTKDQIEIWMWSNGTKENTETELQSKINLMITPTTIINPLPWTI